MHRVLIISTYYFCIVFCFSERDCHLLIYC